MLITERLSSIADELSIVAGLKSNERLRQTYDGAIVAKDMDPKESGSSYMTRTVQNLGRNLAGQSSLKAIQHINELANEILLHLTPTPFEDYLSCTSSIETHERLLSCISNVLSSGLPNFYTTSTTCSSTLLKKSNSEIKEIEALFAAAIDNLKAAEKKLVGKIEEYAIRNEASIQESLPPIREHLSLIVEMILGARSDLIQKNINGYLNFPANTVKEILQESFGDEQIDQVFNFYLLKDATRLTYPDLQALLIGIAANITYKDILELLKKNNGIAYRILSSQINDSLDTLNEQLILRILDSLRSLDVGGAHCPRNRHYSEQLYGDLLLLESCKKHPKSQWSKDSSMRNLSSFGRTEQFAREYAFALFRTDNHLFRKGILLQSYEEGGNGTCFEVHKLFSKEGIYAFASIPLPDISECGNLVTVSFRGAYQNELALPLDPAMGYSGWLLGYQPSLAVPFKDENKVMVGELIKLIDSLKSPNDLKIEVSGQGNGGCIAQRFTEALTKCISGKKGERLRNEIKEINLYCFDSLPVEDPIVKRFIAKTALIATLNTDFIRMKNSESSSSRQSAVLMEQSAGKEPLEAVSPLAKRASRPERSAHSRGLTFNLRYFSSSTKSTYKAGSHYLGFLENESEKSKNLKVTWMHFSFYNSKGEVVEQLSDCCPPHYLEVKRFYKPPQIAEHNDPFFVHHRYGKEELNPVSLSYYCTSNRADLKLIPQESKEKDAQATNLPVLLEKGICPRPR